MGHSKCSCKGEVYSNTTLHQETKIQNKLTTPKQNKQTKKPKQTKPKISRRKEIIKIRAEINELGLKKIEKIKLKANSSKR